MDPREIRFTQDTASPNFSDGGTITEAVAKLRRDPTTVSEFPVIRVVEYKLQIWSLDNRRLTCFKAAQLDEIPVQLVDLNDPVVKAEFLKKFRPINDGLNNIIVPKEHRGDARKLLREHNKYD